MTDITALVRELLLPRQFPDTAFRVLDRAPDYAIGDHGSIVRIRDTIACKAGHVLSACKMRHGYMDVRLFLPDGSNPHLLVHRLVAEAFHGPCPDGLQVGHINGIRDDNRALNLKYCTPSENTQDRWLHGTMLIGSKHPAARLTESQVPEILAMRRGGSTYKQIADAFTVSIGAICGGVRGVTWPHVTRGE